MMITYKLAIPTCALLMSSSFKPVAYTSIVHVSINKVLYDFHTIKLIAYIVLDQHQLWGVE